MNSFDAFLYVITFWRRIVFSCLFVAIATFFVVDLFPKTYYTEAKIVLLDGSKSSMGALSMAGLDKVLGSSMPLNSGSKNDLIFIDLLEDRAMLLSVIHKFNLDTLYEKHYDNSNLKAFRKDLNIAQDEKSGIIQIGFTGKDRKLAIQIINELVNVTSAKYKQIQIDRIQYATKYLRDRQRSELDTILNTQSEMLAFYKKNNVYDYEKQLELSVEIFGKISESLAMSKMKKDILLKTLPSESEEVLLAQKEVAVIENSLKDQKLSSEKSKSLTLSPDLGIGGKIKSENFIMKIKSHYEVLKLIIIELAQTEGELSKNAPTIQVLSEAYFPDWKTKPKRMFWMPLCVAITFFILYLYYMIKGIKTGAIILESTTQSRLNSIQSALKRKQNL